MSLGSADNPFLQVLLAAVERSGDVFFAVDAAWRLVYVNPAARELSNVASGSPSGAVLGQTLWEAFPVLQGTHFEREYRRAMADQKPAHFEAAGLITGTWYAINVYPAGDGLLIYARDITRRKQVEDALRVSEQRFATAFAASPDALVISRKADGTILEINRSFEDLFGYSRAEAVGRTALDLGLFADPADRARAVAQLDAQGSLRDYRLSIRHRTGRQRQVSLTVEQIEIEALPCMLTIVRDITAAAHAEQALRTSEERFRLAARAVSGIIYDWDVVAGTIFYSQGLERVVGVSPEVTPQTSDWWMSLLHPDDLPRVYAAIQAALSRGEESFEVEYRVRHAQGHWVDLWDRGYVVRDPEGRVIRVVGSSTDISRRKQAEAALQAAHAELEERVRARTEELEEANRRIALLQQVAVAANEATTLEQALQTAVDLICAHTGWPVGHCYGLTQSEPPRAVPLPIWHLADPDRYRRLYEVTMRTTFTPGDGWVGQIFQAGTPSWLADVTQDPSFLRAELVRELDVQAGFAVPVQVGQETVVVLEFFTSTPVTPDPNLLEVMAQIGTLLGRVVERTRAQEALRQHEFLLQKVLETIPVGVWLVNEKGEIVQGNPEGRRIWAGLSLAF